jgi:septal ring factor EnvC (AmiA/AmiB activator)
MAPTDFWLVHFIFMKNKCPTMFNFTKKYSNALVASNEKIVGMSEKYDAAIEKIERLEDELSQKIFELDQSSKAQEIMSEGVKKCVESLYAVQNQLQAVASHLDRSNKRIFELMRKNKILKSSGDEWFRRSIKLEFEVLMARDELKKIEIERDSALRMCEFLQTELLSNNRDGKQD